MTDSRLKSLTENFINILCGFPLAYISNYFILPIYGNGINNHDGFAFLMIGVWYTIISVVRSYVFRRIFERFGEHENFYTLLLRLIKRIKKI